MFGGVISGFQRYDANNMVAIATSIAVAVVNAVVLLAGYGLVTLVAATTCVRIVAYFVYRNNAYRIFPELADPPVAVQAKPAARSHGLQRLLVGHRLGEQAELPARSSS